MASACCCCSLWFVWLRLSAVAPSAARWISASLPCSSPASCLSDCYWQYNKIHPCRRVGVHVVATLVSFCRTSLKSTWTGFLFPTQYSFYACKWSSSGRFGIISRESSPVSLLRRGARGGVPGYVANGLWSTWEAASPLSCSVPTAGWGAGLSLPCAMRGESMGAVGPRWGQWPGWLRLCVGLGRETGLQPGAGHGGRCCWRCSAGERGEQHGAAGGAAWPDWLVSKQGAVSPLGFSLCLWLWSICTARMLSPVAMANWGSRSTWALPAFEKLPQIVPDRYKKILVAAPCWVLGAAPRSVQASTTV